MYSSRLPVWLDGKKITYRSKRWSYVHLCCLDPIHTPKYLVAVCCSFYTGHSCVSLDGKSAYQRLCAWINSRKSNSLVVERLHSWRIICNGNTLQFYKDMWPKDIFCNRINCHSCNWHVFHKLSCRNKPKSNEFWGNSWVWFGEQKYIVRQFSGNQQKNEGSHFYWHWLCSSILRSLLNPHDTNNNENLPPSLGD